MTRRRERLDVLLVERGVAPTRARAQALILAGRVRSGTDRLTKPGHRYDADVELSIDEGRRHVGRGAYKLEAALREFDVDVAGRDALDVGASTGGFTEVLLDAGVRRVAALDVGRGQLDWSLRQDDRVVVLEGVNARYLDRGMLPFLPNLVSIDVSFISLELILPPVFAVLAPMPPRDVIVLVKPQFEVGRGQVGRGGIVRDVELHRRAIEKVIACAVGQDAGVGGVTVSPITGSEGNREFLLHVSPDWPGLDAEALDRAVAAAIVSRAEDSTNP
jgi:23S rRNA (cytidine1920-2'-O)/16S rRNA (cytidine1409-2'-O)-methyltransferase